MIRSDFNFTFSGFPRASGGCGLCADGSGSFFLYGYNNGPFSPLSMIQVESAPGTAWTPPWQVTTLAPWPWPGPLYGRVLLASDRAKVWVLGPDGVLRYFRKDMPNQTPVVVTSMMALGVTTPPGYSWSTQLQCTNGRELIVSLPVGACPAHIYAIDVEANPITARPLLTWPLGTTWPAATVRPGRDGKYLVMKHPSLYELDASTGTLSAIPGYSTAPYSPSPLPTAISEPYFDYDPWTDLILTGTDGYAYVLATHLHNSTGWGAALWDPTHILLGIASLAPRPFEVFGSGCRNGLQREPRLVWQGMPQQGSTFSLDLRDGEPNGLALIWIGWSDAYWLGVGGLPYDAAPFGAPGCRLLVAPDGPLPFILDGRGAASYSIRVPTDPVITGVQAFAQSVSSSTANALGFASSDALVIRLW